MHRPLKWFGKILLCLLAVSSLHLYAQQAPAPKPDLAGIAHAAIRVADLDKSREFYAKLGYEEAFAMTQGTTTTLTATWAAPAAQPFAPVTSYDVPLTPGGAHTILPSSGPPISGSTAIAWWSTTATRSNPSTAT